MCLAPNYFPKWRIPTPLHTQRCSILCLVSVCCMWWRQKSLCDVHEGCFKVLRTCADKELVRIFLKNHYYRADRRPMSTIAGLLGERRIATPCNHDQGSSYASALPGDNFTPQGSAKGISSSAGSASVNNLTKETSSMSDLDPVVEKHCIYFTRRTE